MKVLNLSFYVVPKHELSLYLERHRRDSAIFGELNRMYALQHLHLVERSAALPPDDAENRFFAAAKRFPLRAMRFIRKFDPDVMIVHSFDHPLTLIAIRMMIKRKPRIVVWHHAEKPRRAYLKKVLQRAAYAAADRYLFAGNELADPFIRTGIIGHAKNVRQIMEVSTRMRAIDRTVARTQLGIGAGTVFLWVGRLNDNKDPMTVVRAFSLLKPPAAPHLYMIYSDSELEEQVRHYISANALSPRVTMLGRLSHELLAAWYSAADCFVAASHYEGSGTALCEAMACGCVPVITDIPSFRFMTRNGECAYVYPPGNHHRLAEILESLINGNAKPLATTPQQVFRERLSYEAISERLAEIVNELRDRP